MILLVMPMTANHTSANNMDGIIESLEEASTKLFKRSVIIY